MGAEEFEEHRSRLLGVAYRMLGGRSPASWPRTWWWLATAVPAELELA